MGEGWGDWTGWGDWSTTARLFAGVLVMLVVRLVRDWPGVRRLPSGWLSLVAVGLAVAGTFGASLAMGRDPARALADGLLDGLTVGLAAVGSWEVAGKPGTRAVRALSRRYRFRAATRRRRRR